MLSSFQLFNFTPCGILRRKRVHIHSHTDTYTHTHSLTPRQSGRENTPANSAALSNNAPQVARLFSSPPYRDLCRINRQKDQVLHAPPGSSPSPSSLLVPLNCKRIRERASATEHLEFTTAQNEKLQNASRRVKRVGRQPREPETSQRSKPASKATLGIRIRVRFAFCGKLSSQRLMTIGISKRRAIYIHFFSLCYSCCLLK